ncbi:MAG: glycosyltransferase [Gammaproteobacteria bacterium]|nr:glycosyltransferase [Gammaproteobacteria bacterium]
MADGDLRVLHISARADVGGGPEHLYQLCRKLQDMGVESYIACPQDFPYWQRYQSLLGSSRLFQIPHRKFDVTRIFGLAKWIKAQGIRRIHSHGKGAGAYALCLSFLVKLDWVHTPHGIHVGEYGWLKKKMYIFYERLAGFFIRCVIHVSEGEKTTGLSLRLWPVAKLTVIQNGTAKIESSRQEKPEIRASLGFDVKSFIVLSVSRFDYAKNMSEALRIAERLPHMLFVWLGDGPERTVLEAESRARKINNVIFVGNVADVRPYLQASDVYLSTSRWEGMSLAALEAMSAGIPLLLSDVVGNQDLVRTGVNGLLYPLGRIDVACKQLDYWSHHLEEVRSLGENSRKWHALHYSVDKMANATKMVYLDES